MLHGTGGPAEQHAWANKIHTEWPVLAKDCLCHRGDQAGTRITTSPRRQAAQRQALNRDPDFLLLSASQACRTEYLIQMIHSMCSSCVLRPHACPLWQHRPGIDAATALQAGDTDQSTLTNKVKRHTSNPTLEHPIL